MADSHKAAIARRYPFLMEINDITLRDVLIGDLWLMSGQSNQELDIKRVVGLFPEVNVSDNNKIRHFKVPKATSPYPQKDIPEGESGNREWPPK